MLLKLAPSRRVRLTALFWAIGFAFGTGIHFCARLIGALTFSPGQLTASLDVACAFIVMAYLLGLGDGKERAIQQLREQARENGSEWLESVVGRHR